MLFNHLRGGICESALQVANFNPFKDIRSQMKRVTVVPNRQKSSEKPLPFVQLIIALKETTDMIAITHHLKLKTGKCEIKYWGK